MIDANFCHKAATKPYYQIILSLVTVVELLRDNILCHFLTLNLWISCLKAEKYLHHKKISVPGGIWHEAQTMLANQANIKSLVKQN